MAQLAGTFIPDNVRRVRKYVVSTRSEVFHSADVSEGEPDHYPTPDDAADSIRRGVHDDGEGGQLFILALDIVVIDTFSRKWVSTHGEV